MLCKKVQSSAVNCSIVIVAALPLLPLMTREWWRLAVLALSIIYHTSFRHQCPGNYIAGLKNSRPVSLAYVVLYTAGFATILYSYLIPFDLLAVYVLAQLVCYLLTGNTIPGVLTGEKTYDPKRSAG